MTDWTEHTGDTCPVDPETMVEVRHKKHHRVSSGKALYMPWGRYSARLPEGELGTPVPEITHYRIITPAKPPEAEEVVGDKSTSTLAKCFLWSNWVEVDTGDGKTARYRVAAFGPNGAVPPTDDAPEVTFKSDLFKDPEPEMAKTAQEHAAAMFATAIKPEPDLITLRLECLKLAVNDHFYEAGEPDYEQVADRFLHYVLNGSADKAP